MADLKTKLYQMFILGLEGGEYKKVLSNGLGGVIFFTKDIQNVEQFKSLISQIKNISLISPFLSIDQEGGRVERTENIHNGKKYLSAKYAFEKGEDFLALQTDTMAAELKDYGINLNFAPCIDTNTNPNNPIIGERAYSSNPDEVIIAENIVSGIYRKYGIIPCIKHYPGHGDANADSHLTLPEINLSMNEMKDIHIKPFEAAIKNGADMVMAAHLHCMCFDKEVIPTSLSKNALSYLRNELGFDGVIISDDMVMKGVADFGEVEAFIMGIKAGLNLFIYRNSDSKIINVIEKIYQIALENIEIRSRIEDSYERIINLKEKFSV
ncbi:hypothetical protein IJ596_05220 [bacterium]|nr:hypothetical protein [bacterium]